MLTITTLYILDPTSTSWAELIVKGGYAWIDPYLAPCEPRPLEELALATSDHLLTHEALLADLLPTAWEWAGARELFAVGARFPDLEDVFALGTVHNHAEYGPCSPAIERRHAGRVLSLDPLPERWAAGRKFLVRKRA